MEKADAGGKGRIVLATVKGDVHDIGKNLVDIIFTNNGYEVHNLGIKVPLADMLDAAAGDRRGRHRHVRSAGQEHPDHAGEPPGDERTGPLRHPHHPRWCGPDPYLRRTRPALAVRRPAVLWQGRLRRPAHHGPAHGRSSEAARTTPTSAGPSSGRGRRPAPQRPRRRHAQPQPIRIARRGPIGRHRQHPVRAAVRRKRGSSGAYPSTTSPPTSTRPPCSGPSGATARTNPSRRATPSSRTASAPSCGRSWLRPGPRGCSNQPWPTATSPSTPKATTSSSGRTTTRTSEWLRFTFPRQGSTPGCRSPISSGPPRPARPTTPPSTSSPWARRCRRRRPVFSPRTTIRTTCTCTASASRWPRVWPSSGTIGSGRSGGSSARTARPSAASSASNTGVGATRGATTPARTWRTTPSAPSWSVPSGSALRSARRRRGSSTRSRPRRPSSATIRRPSTSWSAA